MCKMFIWSLNVFSNKPCFPPLAPMLNTRLFTSKYFLYILVLLWQEIASQSALKMLDKIQKIISYFTP